MNATLFKLRLNLKKGTAVCHHVTYPALVYSLNIG